MTSLKAQQLLWTLAKQYNRQKTTFSRSEIVAKINELKYLAGQRNVPRLSLQREIQHLEHKLEPLKLILSRVKADPAKVMVLNQQISFLENKLKELLQEWLIPPVKEEIKHTILFDVKGMGLPQEIDARLERELPLPPPPKMRR